MLRKYFLGALLFTSIHIIYTEAAVVPYAPRPPSILEGEGDIMEVPAPPQVDAPIYPRDGLVTTSDGTAIKGTAISRVSWTYDCDSEQSGNPLHDAFDNNDDTFWHTEWNPTNVALPHAISIDLQQIYNVNGFSYLPRQDGNFNGNIGEHQIYLSQDGHNWGAAVAFGTYADDNLLKTTSFETTPARYVYLAVFTEAGNRGPWTSAAEFNIYEADSYSPPPTGLGRWGPTIDFPVVPVAAAVEWATGKVITWSSYSYDTFANGNGVGKTQTAIYDPLRQTVSQRTVTETGHDMFCPGVCIDAEGRVIVTGGNSNQKTSIYDPKADTWVSGANMQIARGYQSSVTSSGGDIFVIGGSWSGGRGGKVGETYDPTQNTWTLLPNSPVIPMQTNDEAGLFRADNHAWLFNWKDGSVFQAGPSKNMNWYGVSGGYLSAGLRGDDNDAMCGNAVMYDATNGKILTLGGSINYENSPSSTAAHVITLGETGNIPTVAETGSMALPRIFGNAVVLPDGKVFVTGGQVKGVIYSDDGSVLTPEMWDPATDATVLSGGGGLCANCLTNHFDAQIYTPQYLLNADGSPATRPQILSSEEVISGTNSMTFTTDSPIVSACLIRYGSSTHTVNTDQRRIELSLSDRGGNSYSIDFPTENHIATPGYWMLFALNSAGVPSKGQNVQIPIFSGLQDR